MVGPSVEAEVWGPFTRRHRDGPKERESASMPKWSYKETAPGSGRWDIYVSLDGPKDKNGKPPKIHRRHRGSEADVQVRIGKLLEDVLENEGYVPDNPTLGQYCKAWLAHKRPDVSAQTYRNYSYHLATACDGIGRTKRMRDIERKHIKAFRTWMATVRGLSENSRHSVEAVVWMLFAEALQDGVINRNPCGGLKKTGTKRNERRVLSPEEAPRFFQHIEGTAVCAPMYIMYAAGLRPQEVVALRWTDVDLEAGVIRVRKAIHIDARGIPALKDPKGKEARAKRDISVNAATVEALKAQRKLVNESKLRLGTKFIDKGMVFPSFAFHGPGLPAGRIWTPGALADAFEKVRGPRESHTGDWSWVVAKTMRHSAITTMLKKTRDYEWVSRWAGHADTATTIKFYSHVFDGEMPNVVMDTPSLAISAAS